MTILDMTLTGDWKVVERLAEQLKVSRNRAAYRSAALAGARVIRKQVKRAAPKASGGLRKTMTQKAKTYSAKGVVAGIIGPQRKPEKSYTISTPDKRVRARGRLVQRRHIPAAVFHLVVGGHRIVVGGTLSRDLGYETRSGVRRRRMRYSRDKTRSGKGGVVGTAPGNRFMELAMDRAAKEATTQFLKKYAERVRTEFAKAKAKGLA